MQPAVIVDIVLVAIMAAVIISAMHKGFIVSVFKLLSAVVSVIAASAFYKQLGRVFYDSFFLKHVSDYVGRIFTQSSQNNSGGTDVSALIENLPEQFLQIAGIFGINSETLSQMSADTNESLQTMMDKISEKLAMTLSNLLAFAVIFFVSLLVLSIVCFLLNSLAKIPILRGTNRFLGFVFGLAEALVLGVILSGLAAAICGALGVSKETSSAAQIMEQTHVAKFLLGFFPFN